MTFVSIIVPAYNEEKTIEKTLKSLVDQSYPHFEIIVVNNNSSDHTESIAKRYTKKVYTEKKQGYHHAVRRGVRESKGTIITMCDADTIYKTDWLERGVKIFENDQRVVAVYGPALYVDNSLPVKVIGSFLYWFACYFSRFVGVPATSGLNFLIKKSVYEAVGGYDPEIYNMVAIDIELGQRLKKQGILKLSTRSLPLTSARRIRNVPATDYLIQTIGIWFRFLTKRQQSVSYDTYNITSR